MTCSAHASKIELAFSEVDLVSRVEYNMIFPNPDDLKVIEGPFQISLKGVGKKKELEIRFEADEPEIFDFMANHLEIQYCILSHDGESSWSEWMYLSQLPLTIQLRDQRLPSPTNSGITSNSPAQFQLLVKFRVPQSVDIQPGFYQGECSLKIY